MILYVAGLSNLWRRRQNRKPWKGWPVKVRNRASREYWKKCSTFIYLIKWWSTLGRNASARRRYETSGRKMFSTTINTVRVNSRSDTSSNNILASFIWNRFNKIFKCSMNSSTWKELVRWVRWRPRCYFWWECYQTSLPSSVDVRHFQSKSEMRQTVTLPTSNKRPFRHRQILFLCQAMIS